MATRTPITLHEDNAEMLDLTITSDPDDDLTLVTSLELFLKWDSCQDDDDPNVLTLTTADVNEITIVSQASDEIVAQAFIPATALDTPFDRFWRLDTLNAAGDRRTALYGPVEVVNL